MNYNDDSNDSNNYNVTLLSLLTNLNPYSDNNETNDYCPLSLECSLNSCPYEYSSSNQSQPQETLNNKNFNSISTPKPDPISTLISPHTPTSGPMPTSCPCSIAFSDTICIPQGVMHNVNEGTKKVLKPINFNNNNIQNIYQQKQKTQSTMQQNKNHGGVCVIC
jgi:hypothetical protein